MNVAVCLKHAVDPVTAEFDVAADALVERDWLLAPAEVVALEAALRLAEGSGGSVTAVTVGPPRADAVLRHALTYGADSALRVWDDTLAGCLDSFVTARVLAAALRPLAADAIVLGTRSLDGGSGIVGPALAEELGLPLVANASALAVEGGAVVAARAGDAGWRDEFSAPLPAVLAVDEGLHEPRYVAVLGRTYRRGLGLPIATATPAGLGLGAADLAGAVEVRSVLQPKPRTKAAGGAKVAGLSMKEKLAMMRGGGAKKEKELFEGPPAEAAKLVLDKVREWL